MNEFFVMELDLILIEMFLFFGFTDNEDGDEDCDNQMQQHSSSIEGGGLQSNAGLSPQEIEDARLRASARVRQMVHITSGPLLPQTSVPCSSTSSSILLVDSIQLSLINILAFFINFLVCGCVYVSFLVIFLLK